MHPLYSVKEICQVEWAAQANLPGGTLMQRAGQSAAQYALSLIDARGDRKILILAGPGNNGGDALDTAYHLAQAACTVTVVLCGDVQQLPLDASLALQRAQSTSISFTDPAALPILAQQSWTLVIDGLFGIGLSRPLSGVYREVINQIHTVRCPVLALDVPSGLDADTGAVVGPDGIAVRASHTITFIADKPGLHTCEGRDHAGNVEIADLDIAPALFPASLMHLNQPDCFASALHPRAQNSHKGSFGDVIVVGGAHGMQGAAILSARAALKTGAGRIYVAFCEDDIPAFDSAQPELMCRRASDMDLTHATIVAGPGGGTLGRNGEALVRALQGSGAVVLDADALNLIASEPSLRQLVFARKAATVMTPHPLEAARLLAISAKEVQADRLTAARKLASAFNAVVILKGSGTVLARADRHVMINPTGNPALASAGTGDVLAGVCGALLAQQAPAWEAALAAAWLHGRAADLLVQEGTGPIGLTASELIPAIRTALNQVVTMHRASANESQTLSSAQPA